VSSFAVFSLATSAKWSSGIFVIFAYLIYLEKKKSVLYENIKRIKNEKRFLLLTGTLRAIKHSLVFGAVSYLAVTLVFGFNIFNLLKTYGYWKMRYATFSGFALSPWKILVNLYTMFLDILSPLEVILIVFVVIYLVVQIKKWRKTKQISPASKFLLILLIIYLAAATQVLVGNPEVFRAVMFYIPMFMVFGLTLDYFTKKFPFAIKVAIILLFLGIYIFNNVNYPVPYSSGYQNSFASPFYSTFLKGEDASLHQGIHQGPLSLVIQYDQIRPDVDKLKLGSNESIIAPSQITLRSDERYGDYLMEQQFKAKYGRELTFKDKLLFNINSKGRNYKYFVVAKPIAGINATLLKTYSYGGKDYYQLYGFKNNDH